MQDQTWAKFFCIPKNMHSRTPMPNTQSWLNEEESKKSFTPPVVRGSLWSHSVVEITPKVTLRRKLLGEMTFCHFTCISQCDSIIQERLTNIHSNDGARVIFHTHGWSDFWIKCSERIPEFGEKWSYYCWRFPRRILLSKVSAKCCTSVINTAIYLTWARPLETAEDLIWPTCKIQTAFKNLADKHHRKVRIS